MSLRTSKKGGLTHSSDERGVSEIVGALMLVVVVSSAAFGFGFFLHQQQKATQAQKEAELAKSLEKLELAGLDPSAAAFDASCDVIDIDGMAGAPFVDDSWHSLRLTITNQHLDDSTVTALRLNQLMVRYVSVDAPPRSVGGVKTELGEPVVESTAFTQDDIGRYVGVSPLFPALTRVLAVDEENGKATLSEPALIEDTVGQALPLGDILYDFGAQPHEPGYRELVVPARQPVLLTLENLAMDPSSCNQHTTPLYSLFGSPPASGEAGPIKITGALAFEAVTRLTNTIERAFIPPVALAHLETTPGVDDRYILVSDSEAGTEKAFLVKWQWAITWELDTDPGEAVCSDTPMAPFDNPAPTGHRAQITTNPLNNYCVRLTVTDNSGLQATTDFSFNP